MNYFAIVCTDTSFFVVGPFPSKDVASAHFQSAENNPNDDPRWQVIGPRDSLPGYKELTPFQHSVAVKTDNLGLAIS